MSALTVIATILYTIVALSLIGNFIRLFVETKKLKENKQTPLVGKTATTIVVATIVEVVVLFLLLKLVAILNIVGGLIATAIVFTILHFARHIASYLATWAIWGLFVRSTKKKELEKIQQEVKKETGK